MPAEYRIALLVLGALLVVIAVFGARLFGRIPSTLAGTLRALIGVAGAALLAWILVPQLTSPAPPASPAAAAVAPAAPPTAAPAAPVPGNLVRLAALAVQDCPVASAPPVPDGATATRNQMLAARTAFQAYDAAINTYIKCVDAAIEATRHSAGSAPDADLQALKAFGNSAHNTAIDQEQADADQLNVQVRAFKAKHPQG